MVQAPYCGRLRARSHPKQFLPLFGGGSSFQETLRRVSDATRFDRPIVITNHAYRFMMLEQLMHIGCKADGVAVFADSRLQRIDRPRASLEGVEDLVVVAT